MPRRLSTATARPTSRSIGRRPARGIVARSRATGLHRGQRSSVRRGAPIGDVPVPGDYDGDGKTDLAVYRPSTGTWSIVSRRAASFARPWRRSGASAATCRCPATTTATARPTSRSTGRRPASGSILTSSTDFTTSAVVPLGRWPPTSPVPGDYDGDGKTDIAVFRPSTGQWYVLTSSTELHDAVADRTWGVGDRHPGAGRLRRRRQDRHRGLSGPRPATWYILQSSTTARRSSRMRGAARTDMPVPGDYDGDGKTDLAVFRPSTGEWFIADVEHGLRARHAIRGAAAATSRCPATTTATARPTSRSSGRRPGQWYIATSSTDRRRALVGQRGARRHPGARRLRRRRQDRPRGLPSHDRPVVHQQLKHRHRAGLTWGGSESRSDASLSRVLQAARTGTAARAASRECESQRSTLLSQANHFTESRSPRCVVRVVERPPGNRPPRRS